MDDDFPAEFGVYQHVKKAHPTLPNMFMALGLLIMSTRGHQFKYTQPHFCLPLERARLTAYTRMLLAFIFFFFSKRVCQNVAIGIPISRRIFADRKLFENSGEPSKFQTWALGEFQKREPRSKCVP